MVGEDCGGVDIGGEDRGAGGFEAIEDRSLFNGDAFDILEGFEVHGGDGCDHRDMRAGHASQRRDFAGVVHADFDHGIIGVGGHPRQGQWHAPVVVVAGHGGVSFALPREHGAQHFLG